MLTLTLDTVYTGQTPYGDSPWLTAVFSDNSDGTVALQLIANLQEPSGTEFFKSIAFNYLMGSPTPLYALLPANITFDNNPTDVSGGGVGTFAFGFDPDTSNSQGGIKRFDDHDVIDITLYSLGGAINVNMFNVANGSGYYAAAHVNGIATGDGSGKVGDDSPQQPENPTPGAVSAPEPASLALLALGSIGIGGFRLRRKVKAA